MTLFDLIKNFYMMAFNMVNLEEFSKYDKDTQCNIHKVFLQLPLGYYCIPLIIHTVSYHMNKCIDNGYYFSYNMQQIIYKGFKNIISLSSMNRYSSMTLDLTKINGLSDILELYNTFNIFHKLIIAIESVQIVKSSSDADTIIDESIYEYTEGIDPYYAMLSSFIFKKKRRCDKDEFYITLDEETKIFDFVLNDKE